MTLLGHRRPALSDIAYDRIRQDILTGRHPPGSRLVVNELVAEWAISGTPVKEALNRLITEGMVEFEPRRGMRVRRLLTAREVREQYELRIILEEHCCRVAAGTVDSRPETLERLWGILERADTLLREERGPGELYGLDGDFHEFIVSLCGNDEIMREFRRLNASIRTFGMQVGRPFPLRRQDDTWIEHRAVLDALLACDGEKMAAAMRIHLDKSRLHLLAFYSPVRLAETAAESGE